MTRRAILKLSGCGGLAALAAGFGAKNAQKLIPYVIPPTEEYRPGTWAIYATTCRECPAGCGLHMRHIDGRVTKAEGNPAHPLSGGGLCPRGQSSVQGLYDPDRLANVRRCASPGKDQPADSNWDEALAAIGEAIAGGKRLLVISDLQTGTLADVMRQFAIATGGRVIFHEPFNYQPLREAHGQLFARPVVPRYRLEQADYILSFAADFLETWVSPVEFAGKQAARQAYQDGRIGRMDYVGPRLSMTAANADDFCLASPAQLRHAALAVLGAAIRQRTAGASVAEGDAFEAAIRLGTELGAIEALKDSPLPADKISALAKRFLVANSPVALAGPTAADSPAAGDLAIICGLLNALAASPAVDFDHPHALSGTATSQELAEALATVGSDTILILHRSNLAFTSPAAADAITKAGLVVYMGELMDETAGLAHWVLPLDNPLESWGDYEPYPGTQCLMQPTMVRLHQTCLAGDVFVALGAAAGKQVAPADGTKVESFRDWLKGRWAKLHQQVGGKESFEDFWTACLRRGGWWAEGDAEELRERDARDTRGQDALVTRGQDARDTQLQLAENLAGLRLWPEIPAQAADSDKLKLWPWASVYFFDGRTANRPWLQEQPDPISTIAWGSWADMHPDAAGRLGIADGDVIEISTPSGQAQAAVRLTSDVAPDCLAIMLGQGHTAMGKAAREAAGSNAFVLLRPAEARLAGLTTPASSAPFAGMFGAADVRKAGRRAEPLYMSATDNQHKREILQWIDLSQARATQPGRPGQITLPTEEGYDPKTDLYKPHKHRNHRWAMVVDLDRCIGCGACSVACYAENNIPVMGPKACRQGREMAWLKVVPYRHEHHDQKVGFLPVTCQQCDAAPCEPVCPVFAAVHNEDGLNAQVYNRCIGTRYCNNNCPYKVRRFNWLNVEWKKPLTWQLNPEVSVRHRGVMEKCTFCIQRLRHAQLRAKRENRPVRDAEVQPACAQSCPTKTIILGDLMDSNSQVYKLIHNDPRRYQVLRELNTKPAVIYLKRVHIDERISE